MARKDEETGVGELRGSGVSEQADRHDRGLQEGGADDQAPTPYSACDPYYLEHHRVITRGSGGGQNLSRRDVTGGRRNQ